MEYILKSQQAVKRLLERAESGNINQAYIFEGMKGIGKLTAANLFAMALHCSESVKPCGVCPGCKKHLAGTHSDYIVIGDRESSVKVNDIRELTNELFIRPALSDVKVCVVPNADSMNSDAQNALLKSFEEPPEYGVIILISENAKNLLPTIRSRGSRVVFEPFAENVIKRYIADRFPSHNTDADFIASYSGGIIGKAIDICENEAFFETREKMFDAILNMAGDRMSIFKVAEIFGIKNPKSAVNVCDIYFELFMSFMRDVMALKTKSRIINTDKLSLLTDFSSKVTLATVINIIEKTAKIRSQINVSMKYDLWIVNMLINCWEDIHGKSNGS